ncbi:hypothetical protein M0811_12055 [Anaeramoeba ignava]|uniref:Uncharacterized protein n=1 Tax=Anaeramoeba ignava TaxID=1746090 RepID=A0A9Q0LA95_ANAIG|nr:hypothetical protein M0811_12055 [Anaeramoeba ignava]
MQKNMDSNPSNRKQEENHHNPKNFSDDFVFDSFQQNIFTSFNLEDEQRHETIERNIPRNKVGIERGRETTNSGFHTTENINELFPDHKIDIKNRSMDSRFSYDFDLPIEYSPFREDIINEKVEESDECINLYYNLLVLWDPRKGGVNRSVRTDKLPQYFQERDKKLHEMNLL